MGGRHPSGPATRNEAAMLSMSLKSLSNEEESIEESEGEEVVTHSGEEVCRVSGVCVRCLCLCQAVQSQVSV